MNKIANRQVINEVLMEAAAEDESITVLCSDSRGSASLAPFAEAYPKQFVEIGIAEQNLVSVAAGLAHSKMRPFAASPASFVSTRSYEQIKVDVAYSHTNVKLIGISGGVSYGALGMSHHSSQDISAIAALPNMRVYIPSDRHQTRCLMKELVKDQEPAYIRVGRNAVEDVYEEGNVPFEMDKATVLMEGNEVLLIGCGEMVKPLQEAGKELNEAGISTAVLDMYCIKPLDKEAIIRYAKDVKLVVTMEEQSYFGGLGSMVTQVVAENHPTKVINMALPDESLISGNSKQIFDYYGLNKDGVVKNVREALGK